MFVNTAKTADNQPDRTGYILAHRDIKAGEKLSLAGWIKGDPKKPILSLKMSDVRGREQATEQPRSDLDSEIPF